MSLPLNIPIPEKYTSFQAEVRRFLEESLPCAISAKVAGDVPLTKEDYVIWHRLLQTRNWLGGHWPVEHGGSGWSPAQRVVFEIECARANAPRVIAMGYSMLAPVLIRYGTFEQKQRWLGRMLNCEDWWCQGYSEPEAGSDLASLKTSAKRYSDASGEHYIVNGQKTWTTLAQYANMMFCLVRTDPAAKSQAGITFLLVDMTSPGVTVRPIMTLDGAHEVNEVFLENVRVPVDNVVGEENRGWDCAKYLLTHERAGIAGVGQALSVLLKARRSAEAAGLLEESLFSERLARLEMDCANLATTAFRLLEQQGADTAAMSSVLKLRGSELRQAIADVWRRAVGPSARIPNGATDFYLNCRKLSIYGGSNEIQRTILAKHLLSRGDEAIATPDDGASEERQLMVRALEKFFRDSPPGGRRETGQLKDGGYDLPRWSALANMGLLAAFAGEAVGGLGGGPRDVAALFEVAGYHGVREPILSQLVAVKILERLDWTGPDMGAVLDGRVRCALAWQPPGARDGQPVPCAEVSSSGERTVLNGACSFVEQATLATHYLALAHVGQRPAFVWLDAHAEGVRETAFPTHDGSRLSRVEFMEVGVPYSVIRTDGIAEALMDGWRYAVLAICSEGLGAMRRALSMTLEFMQVRRQFGQPLANFQALQHDVANLAVEFEQARSATENLVTALETDEARQIDLALSNAKMTVGQAARLVAEACIQIHGAIGLTDELPLSHVAKRLVLLDHLCGDQDYHLRRYMDLSRQKESEALSRSRA